MRSAVISLKCCERGGVERPVRPPHSSSGKCKLSVFRTSERAIREGVWSGRNPEFIAMLQTRAKFRQRHLLVIVEQFVKSISGIEVCKLRKPLHESGVERELFQKSEGHQGCSRL